MSHCSASFLLFGCVLTSLCCEHMKPLIHVSTYQLYNSLCGCSSSCHTSPSQRRRTVEWFPDGPVSTRPSSSLTLGIRSISRQTRLKDAAGRERAGGFNGEVLMSERAAAHLAWSAPRSTDTAELSCMKPKLQLLIGCTFIFAITRCSSSCQVLVRERQTWREWIWTYGQRFNDEEGLNTHACVFIVVLVLVVVLLRWCLCRAECRWMKEFVWLLILPGTGSKLEPVPIFSDILM